MNNNTVIGFKVYECGICGEYHPWHWKGDCRDDANRIQIDDYAEFLQCDEAMIQIYSMDERLGADLENLHDWYVGQVYTVCSRCGLAEDSVQDEERCYA